MSLSKTIINNFNLFSMLKVSKYHTKIFTFSLLFFNNIFIIPLIFYIGFGNRYTSRTNTEIVCQVPANAEVGTYKIVMEDPDGNKIEGPEFKVVPAEKDIADFAKNEAGTAITYPFVFSWGDGTGKFRLNKADLIKLGVKKGSKLIIYKDASATGQVQINDANWAGLYTIADWNGTETQLVQEFDDKMMNAINNVSDGWSDTAFIIQGDLGKANKIVILP